jgi:hypothetical protein
LKLSNSRGPVFTLNPTHYPLQNERCNRISLPNSLRTRCVSEARTSIPCLRTGSVESALGSARSFIPGQNSSWLLGEGNAGEHWTLPVIGSCNAEPDWYLQT